MSAIELHLIAHQTANGLPYQHLHIHIASEDGLVEPSDLKQVRLPETIVWNQGAIVEGRAPIWLYGYLVHALHSAAWVACFDPRLGSQATPRSGGAIVVATHTREVAVGEVLEVSIPDRLFRQD